MSFNPDKEYNIYSEESDEELGIDYLGDSFEDNSVETEDQEVVSPLNRNSSPRNSSNIPQRKASNEVINRYAPMGVSSIIFNMIDGSSYELIINKRG